MMFVLALVALTPLAHGANTQGLYWGLKNGDRLEYKTVTQNSLPYPYPLLNERFYVLVDSLPPIPDMVTEGHPLSYPNLTLYWENGSDVGLWGIGPSLVPSLAAHLPRVVFPIGNWSVITGLYYSSGLTNLFENESVWVERGGEVDPYTNCMENVTATYLKSDGAIFQYLLTIRNTTTQEEVYHFEVIRFAEQTGLLVPLSVMVIGGTLILIVDIALLIKMRRH
jgi:hypothetical protein